MQNLGILRQLSLGDLADDGRRERGGKIMPSLMATSLRWRTHSARTNVAYTEINIWAHARNTDEKQTFSNKFIEINASFV